MRWKKIATFSAILSSAIIPAVALIATAAAPRQISGDPRYLMRFENNLPKQEYINTLKKDVNKVLDIYQSKNSNFKELNFQIVNLNKTPTPNEIDFYNELNQVLKAIDPRLGITMLSRTPVTVADAFNNANDEMMTFYWSPDYNSVGTWTSYMFSDQFNISNMWLSLYPELISHKSETKTWQKSLYDTLNKGVDVSGNIINLLGPNGTLKNTDFGSNDIHEYYIQTAIKDEISVADIYTSLGNVIGEWIQGNSAIDKQVISSYGIQMVDWMNEFNPNIPFAEDGPQTKKMELVRNGFHVPKNPNGDLNYRDWYVDGNDQNKTYRFWQKDDPFASSVTPYNPNFSQSPNSTWFQSTNTGLLSWSTNGDYSKETDVTPNTLSINKVNDGAENIVDDSNDHANNTILDFEIRPIPWVDTNGKQLNDATGKPAYLSPQDFLAGLEAFQRSVECNLNTNGYFIPLASIDYDATVNDKANGARNESISDHKKFKIHFDAPISSVTKESKNTLNYKEILDVLSKQYFLALPAFKETVQNIIDPNLFEKYAVLNGTTLDTKNSDMNKFYGCGDWTKGWQDWASVGPYYIDDVSRQKIIYERNDKYFDSFPSATGDYESFQIYDSSKNRSKIKKIDMNYAGGYRDQVTFQGFASNELDQSKIPLAEMPTINAKYRDDIYAPEIPKINKSNILSYNTNIYFKDKNGVIKDSNDKPMINSINKPTYTTDKYGNFVFPEGHSPERKDKVSKEYADLIVSNFYTPLSISKNDNKSLDPSLNDKELMSQSSQIIRSAINDCINWYALTSNVFPNDNSSVQYSFMPYGVFDTYAGTTSIDVASDKQYKYWSIAANYNQGSVDNLNPKTGRNSTLSPTGDYPAIRNGGIITWTYQEMIDSWKLQFKK